MAFKTFLHLFIISIIAFVINFFLVENVVPKQELANWTYSIVNLYVLFFLFSVVIMSLLLFVRTKNLDNVGYTYLILTSIKMGVAYFLLRPILATTTVDNATEKINFFIVFIWFLAIETLLTIRILNNKQ